MVFMTERLKIAAIVVSYNPTKDILYKNIKAFVDYVDTIIVWRNSIDDWDFLKEWNEKILFCGEGVNEYMAKPLNFAIKYCRNNGFDYLLTMDQDSLWSNCGGFISCVKSLHENNVGIYAPNVNNQFKSDGDYLVDSVITSGSLLNVKIAYKMGGFREDYKIYWVDGEFCCRLRRTGYFIKVLSQYHLKQQFGKQTKTLFGYTAANYSPIIYYFLFRNMFWMKREYHDNPSLKCVLYTLNFYIRGIVLGENKRIYKLYMILKACIDGCFSPVIKKDLTVWEK